MFCLSETELGLVLIGLVGSGKSSLGNMIIGEEVFDRKRNNILDTSFTETIQRVERKFGRKIVVVLDTPGIPAKNKNTNRYEVLNIFKTAKKEVKEIPHVFLLVISLDTYLSTELLPFLQKHCMDIIDRLIVILTCADHAKETSSDLPPKILRQFIEKNNLKFFRMNCKYSSLESHLDTISNTERNVESLIEICEITTKSKRNRIPKIINLAEI